MLYKHNRSRVNKRRRKKRYTRRFPTIYGGDAYLRMLRRKFRLKNRTRRFRKHKIKMRLKKTKRLKYKQRH